MAGGKKPKRLMSRGEASGSSDPNALPPPSGKGKGDTVSPPPDPDHPRKWRMFGNRRVWPERGIDLSVLGATFVPQAVGELNWVGYVRAPSVAALDLVREFYYALEPHHLTPDSPVIVRGREVRITAARVNQWYGTSEDLGHLVDGLPQHQFFVPYSGDLAADLRMDGSQMWNDYRSSLLQSELKLDAAFWTLFFDYSLAPKTHRSDLGYDTAKYLFCARNFMQMDIGQIVIQSIHRGAKSKGPLPFPCLITHFCEEAGIEWNRAGDNVIAPTSIIGRKTYNELAKRRGVRTIGANIQDEDDLGLDEEDLLGEDPEDADYVPQGPEEGTGASAGPQRQSMEQLMQSMSTQLTTNTELLRSLSQQMTSSHNIYMGEFSSINDRLDAFQRGLTDHGVSIPFTYRREGRRRWGQDMSSSQQPMDPEQPPQDPSHPQQDQ